MTEKSKRPKFKYIAPERLSGEEGQFLSQKEYELFRKSVMELGVINPVLVRKSSGKYTVIDGRKRLKAALDIGLGKIPALVYRCGDKTADELALSSNCQRFEESFVTRARELKSLCYTYGMPLEDGAALAAIDSAGATTLLHTLRLGDRLLNAMVKAGLRTGHALALLRLGDDRLRETALCEMAYSQISESDAAGYVDKLLNRGEKPSGEESKKLYVMNDLRFFLNSIGRSVELIRTSGVDAKCTSKSSDEGMVVTINIPTPSQKLNAG